MVSYVMIGGGGFGSGVEDVKAGVGAVDYAEASMAWPYSRHGVEFDAKARSPRSAGSSSSCVDGSSSCRAKRACLIDVETNWLMFFFSIQLYKSLLICLSRLAAFAEVPMVSIVLLLCGGQQLFLYGQIGIIRSSIYLIRDALSKKTESVKGEIEMMAGSFLMFVASVQ